MARTKTDRALARYVRRHVYPFSAFEHPRLDEAGLGRRGVRTQADLRRLPATELADVVDPRDIVLRPDEDNIRARAGLVFRARVRWAMARRGEHFAHSRLIDDVYKPVHWTVAAGVPIAASTTDLYRLADLGVRWLEQAGVHKGDVIVTVGDRGPRLAKEQLTLACRRAQLSALHLGAVANPALVASLRPTVLAGAPDDLLDQLQGIAANGDTVSELRLVLALDDPLDEPSRQRLRDLAPAGASVLSAWAPPGVRAAWVECRGTDGLHTWPQAEVLESDNGELVWSALGWKGSALLRLRTGVRATVDATPCRHCGQTSPRLRVTGVTKPAADLLEAHPAVAAWQIERRRGIDGDDETVVYLAPTARRLSPLVLHELDRELSVTQFVVLPRRAVEARLDDHGGRRIVDLRP